LRKRRVRLFKIIDDRLATQGIREFSYKVLSEKDPQTDELNSSSWPVADVRTLLDDGSSTLEDYERKIDFAWELVQKHGRVVVCYSAGVSRSNAITLGVLVKYFKMDIFEALDLIKKKVPIADIDPLHIIQLRKLFKIGR
jgi:hypothetical protein